TPWSKRAPFLAALTLVATLQPGFVRDQEIPDPGKKLEQLYTKQAVRIPMRDGVHLFTAVYAPKDASQPYPILMVRTPYSVGPYEKDKVRSGLGPNRFLARAGYIFVYQDVRGCYMSEGKFDNMRPHLDQKAGKHDIDESSDT